MQWRVKTVKLEVEASAKADIKIVSPSSQVKTKLTRVQKGKWVPKAPATPTTMKIEAEFLCSSSKELVAAQITCQPPKEDIIAKPQAKPLGISKIFTVTNVYVTTKVSLGFYCN